MMTLPKFQFLAPETLKEAVELLDKHSDEAKVIAGGTDLLVSMKQKLFTPNYLIGLDKLKELKNTEFSESEGLKIGAAVTLAEITSNKEIKEKFPVLALAAGKVATVTLRNKGTIGGNVLLDTRCYYYNQSFFWRKSLGYCMKKDGTICHVAPGSPRCRAIISTDIVPALITLNATVTFLSNKGDRTIPLNEFYNEDGMEWRRIQPDEILVSVNIPNSPKGFKATYHKLRRRETIDYPMLGVAVSYVENENGEMENPRIVMTAIQSSPLEVPEASKILEGKKPTQELIAQASELAYKIAKPLDLTNAPPLYRKKMVRVFVKRALEELAGF